MKKKPLPPNPRGHNLPSKYSFRYKISLNIIKALTFWIFPKSLRKQFRRDLRYIFQIDLKPESILERYRHNKRQQHYVEKYSQTDLFSYHIVSLGGDCLCRTIPTLWGIKPRKNQGEISYPFDLSLNPLEGVVKNLEEDFLHYFDDITFSGKFWTLPYSQTTYCHDDDCGPNDKDKIRERFSRRINNLKSVYKTDKPVIFVNHYCKNLNGDNAQNAIELYNRLYNILKQKRQEKPFKLLIIDYSQTLPANKLPPEIELLSASYLPKTYVWNYPEYRLSKLGLKFEESLVKTIENLIDKMRLEKK